MGHVLNRQRRQKTIQDPQLGKVTIVSTPRTYMANLIGFNVTINERTYRIMRLTRQEAVDSALKKYKALHNQQNAGREGI